MGPHWRLWVGFWLAEGFTSPAPECEASRPTSRCAVSSYPVAGGEASVVFPTVPPVFEHPVWLLLWIIIISVITTKGLISDQILRPIRGFDGYKVPLRRPAVSVGRTDGHGRRAPKSPEPPPTLTTAHYRLCTGWANTGGLKRDCYLYVWVICWRRAAASAPADHHVSTEASSSHQGVWERERGRRRTSTRSDL